MKNILLMRHAKSGWDNPRLKDFERHLTTQGIKDASAMGKFIQKSGYVPERIISSPAKRAKLTSALCMEGAALDNKLISYNKDFYYGTEKDYLKAIQESPQEHNMIMLIGHNPLMEGIAGILAGSGTTISVKMSSGTLICLECFVDCWHEVAPGTCNIKWMMTPEIMAGSTE